MREFLKDLGLEKEAIDSIMAEHGKQITSYKEQAENYKKEVEEYKGKIDELNNTVKGLNDTIEQDKKSLENLQTVTSENDDLKAQLQMTGANVKKEFSKFVTSEVRGMVNEKTDFAKALEEYKKDNPQYFGDTVIKKVQTSPELTGGNTAPKTTNDKMNDILRGALK